MVPYLDLTRQYQAIKDEVDAAIEGVLSRGWFILGEEVAAFEEEFARYIGAPYAVGVGTGTAALHVTLLALGVGPGDEVVTVPNTALATASAISLTGATPTFADIDPQSYNMDPHRLEAAITPRTRAIIPVHLFGQSADMDPILDIAHRHNIPVLEDACQAHGAEYKGVKVGNFGDAAAFSFYPTKNLGAYGDGGMVVTRRQDIAEQVRLLRNLGQRDRYHHAMPGTNSRLDELQAAILRVKLRHLDEGNAARREGAALYDQLLAGCNVVTPKEMAYGRHVYHLYVAQSHDRDALRSHLDAHGVGTLVHYPLPIHLQEAYRTLGLGPGSFPVAEEFARRILSIPLYPEIRSEEIAEVCRIITTFA